MKHFIFIGLLFSCYALKANNKLIDFVNGNKYIIEGSYREKHISSLNMYEEISFNVHYLEGMKDAAMQDKLKQKLFQLGFFNLDSAGYWERLLKFHSDYVANYIRINKRDIDLRGYYSDNIKLFSPYVEEVELNILAVYNNIITIERVVEFSSKYDDYEIENIEYRQMFYFDLRNLKEYTLPQFFNAASLPELDKMMTGKILDYYNQLESVKDQEEEEDEYGYYDDEDEDEDRFYNKINKETKPKVKQLKNYSSNSVGYWVFTYPIFRYYIPAYEPSTEDFKSVELVLNIDYAFISKYMSVTGPMQYIKTTAAAFNTKMQNCNHYKIVTGNGQPTWYRNTEMLNGVNDYVLNIGSGPRLIKIYSDDQSNEKQKRLRSEIRYDKNGFLIKLTQLNDNGYEKVEYDFIYQVVNGMQVLKTVVGQKKGKLVSKTELTYDNNGNLIRHEDYELSDRFTIQDFYYKDSTCVMVSTYFGETKLNLQQMTYSQGHVIRTDYIHQDYITSYISKYDKNGNLLFSIEEMDHAVPSYNRSPNATFYAYNDNNQLMSKEYDNGRYKNFYLYDKSNNCILVMNTGYDTYNESSYKVIYNSRNEIIKVIWNPGRSTTPMVFYYEYE